MCFSMSGAQHAFCAGNGRTKVPQHPPRLGKIIFFQQYYLSNSPCPSAVLIDFVQNVRIRRACVFALACTLICIYICICIIYIIYTCAAYIHIYIYICYGPYAVPYSRQVHTTYRTCTSRHLRTWKWSPLCQRYMSFRHFLRTWSPIPQSVILDK